MEERFKVTGMSCNGCRIHVEQALSEVDGVQAVVVNLENAEAYITSRSQLKIEQLERALGKHGGRYQIARPGCCSSSKLKVQKTIASSNLGDGLFYCPMRCEGDRMYTKPGDCPVCGMDLVQEVTSSSMEDSTYLRLRRKFWIAVSFTVPVFLIAMSDMFPGLSLKNIASPNLWAWLQCLLSLPVIFYAAWMFFQRAYRSIIHRNLNMFTLIGIGSGVAWLFSVLGLVFPDFFPSQFKDETGQVQVYFEAATVILTLVLLGQVLEARAHSKTNSAVRELLELTPETAIRVADGVETEIPVAEIQKGDLLRIRPGTRIPVDGIIYKGYGTLDESMITGEPIPVDKNEGDTLHSGTLNGNQSFLMQAVRVGAETLLAQIIKLVNSASQSRAPIQQLADRISAYFVPAVVGIALLTALIWAFLGPEPAYVYALVNGIAVLIIACPCALGLATPMSVMVGVGKGAQNGILIRDAAALEMFSKINVLLVDKTGTLTEGKPKVVHVEAASNSDNKELIGLAAGLNSVSEHPLARAVVDYARESGVVPDQVDQFSLEPGKGVTGLLADNWFAMGNVALMQAHGIKIPNILQDQAQKHQEVGETVSYLASATGILGFVAFGDRIKPDARLAIEALEQYGVAVVMLTGDDSKTANVVAQSLGIKQIKAGLLPGQKLEVVDEFKSRNLIVAMAGDGINDAPALAGSHVGIAMGTGTDIAIDSAGITLIQGDLTALIRAYKLSKAVNRNIRQNLFFALFYNALGVPVAAGILFPFFGVLLSPMLAAAAMSFSSVSVIANALRLRRVSLSL